MSSATAADTQNQAPKFSRYRSVRRAAAAVITEDAPAIPEGNATQLNRAPSRYHRANRQRTQTVPLPTQPASYIPQDRITPRTDPVCATKSPSPPSVPVQAVPLPIHKPDVSNHPDKNTVDKEPIRRRKPSDAATPQREQHLSRAASTATRSLTAASPKSYEAAREEARMILEGEYDRIKTTKEIQKPYARRRDVEAPDLKRRPTQTQQKPSQPVYVDAPKLNARVKIERTLPDKFHDAPRSIGTLQQPPGQQSTPSKGQDAKQQATSKPFVPVDAPITSPPRPYDAPKFDAPVSAVNAGDRRVEVRLNNADRGITLPVTPTTNSRDLLNSASIVMSENFNPRTSILVESFSHFGLERPLRRYEHVREVMNSWDADDQNHLTIMTDAECQATGLERNEAPEEPPNRVMLQMLLSLRPGKWEKRWIILRPDGQVTMSKQENDGDGTNICHLSDFDVYTPTAKQRKKLKPPKKFCFAVKSQQKSAMFLEGINFIHFFATSDKQVADRWYTAVQTWRSWYLVYVLGDGAPKPKESYAIGGNIVHADARPATAQSTDSTPYQLGSFKPLLDLSDLTFGTPSDNAEPDGKVKNASSSIKKPSVDLGVGKTSLEVGTYEATRRGSRQRGLPPSSFPLKLFSENEKHRQSLDNTEQAFTGGGLLGRSISVHRSQGGKSSGHGVAGARGKPLVDLTPASEFAEGSLLRKLEAWSATQGENEVKIDRQRRVEADIRVGEGLS